jgi:GAF domain-containing protein
MQDWRVSSGTIEIVVEAEDWLDALAVGIVALGMDPAELPRLSCAIQRHGGAVARDLTTGQIVRVEPVAAAPESEPELAPAAVVAPIEDDLLEDLFLRLGAISSSNGVAEASAVALRVVLDYVGCEAGAVLIRTRSGDGLRFRAVSGPAAGRLVDSVIPLANGIAGYVTQLGIGIAIDNARQDQRHNAQVDRSTGFRTGAMLAVPVRGDSSASAYGCLELLNPKKPFSGWDFDVAARVAASLGTFFDSVYAVR